MSRLEPKSRDFGATPPDGQSTNFVGEDVEREEAEAGGIGRLCEVVQSLPYASRTYGHT